MSSNEQEIAEEIHAQPVIRFEDHIGLLRTIVKKFIPPAASISDSEEYAEGCFGLMKAIENFRPQESAFSTYATHCIKNAIINYRKSRKSVNCINDLEGIDRLDAKQIESDLVAELHDAIRQIPVETATQIRDKSILIDYYINGLSWKEVADKHNFSKQRAQQIGDKLLRHLKQLLTK